MDEGAAGAAVVVVVGVRDGEEEGSSTPGVEEALQLDLDIL
jgi:hypothetical protein